jgi:hypothetical protein
LPVKQDIEGVPGAVGEELVEEFPSQLLHGGLRRALGDGNGIL